MGEKISHGIHSLSKIRVKREKLFSYLFFLLLNLLMFTLALGQTSWPIASDNPQLAFLIGIIVYFGSLIFLVFQNQSLKKFLSRERILFISNFFLLVLFMFEYFVIGSQRLLLDVFYPIGETGSLAFFLFLYFFAMHTCQKPFKKEDKSLVSVQFLIPFVIPFLTLTFLVEMEPYFQGFLSYLISAEQYPSLQMSLMIGINIFIFFLAILIFPPIAVYFWNCQPLKAGIVLSEHLKVDASLIEELNQLCERTRFRHGGLKIWTVMKNACTAAIIGVVSPLRYILFTTSLLKELSSKAIVAVLAHEIGHSKKHHLLMYPFIFLGMAAFGTFIFSLIEMGFYLIQNPGNSLFQIERDQGAIKQLFLFTGFATAMAIYFRYVFGYFSRIFERQADLYVLEAGIPAADMIEALDTLGVVYGNIHNKPNWHHYSIQERIDNLKKADANPSYIQKHSNLVKTSLMCYALCLILLLTYLFF